MDVPKYQDNIVIWLESFADANSDVIINKENDKEEKISGQEELSKKVIDKVSLKQDSSRI